MEAQHRVGCLGPFLAALLARPEAAGARRELALALELGVSPSQLRGAPSITTYEYDDQGRVTRAITASAWGEPDRALMLAYKAHLDTLCPGCGEPREHAHHPDTEGEYEVDEDLICNGCAAIEQWKNDRVKKPDSVEPGTLPQLVHDRDYESHPLPPLKPSTTPGRR